MDKVENGLNTILLNPGIEEIRSSIITSLLFKKSHWTKDKAEKWVKSHYKWYEYEGEGKKYYHFRIIPKKMREEFEEKYAREKNSFRVIPFSPEKGILARVMFLKEYVELPEELTPRKKSEVKELKRKYSIALNPARKLTPEIRKAIKEYGKKGYAPTQIKALIKEKFNVKLSYPTIRKVLKGIGDVEKNLEGIEGGAMEAKSVMKYASKLYKAGKAKNMKEALKLAWKEAKKGGVEKMTASEILINKGGKMARKRRKRSGTVEALLEALSLPTETITEIEAPARRRIRRGKGAFGRLMAKVGLGEAMRKFWTPERRDLIRKAYEEAWSSKEGLAFKARLRSALRPYLQMLWGKRAIPSTATEEILGYVEDIFEPVITDTGNISINYSIEGIEAIEARVRRKGIGRIFALPAVREAIRSAWASKEGEAFKKKLRDVLEKAWKEAGFGTVLSREIKRAYPVTVSGTEFESYITDLGMIGEEEEIGAIEQVIPPVVIPEEVKSYIRTAIRKAWAGKRGEEMREALKRVWETPEGRRMKSELASILKGIVKKAKEEGGYPISETEIGAIDQLLTPDFLTTIGADRFIPSLIAVLGESWISFFWRKLVAIPFGKNAKDEKHWLSWVYKIVAGATHYAGANTLLQFIRIPTFPFLSREDFRTAYSALVIRDTLESLFPQILPTPNLEKIRALQAPPKPTSETEVGLYAVDTEKLTVDEEGNLVVPEEYYKELTPLPEYEVEEELPELPEEEVFDVAEEEEETIAEEIEEIEEGGVENIEEKEEEETIAENE